MSVPNIWWVKLSVKGTLQHDRVRV